LVDQASDVDNIQSGGGFQNWKVGGFAINRDLNGVFHSVLIPA
jgi:hypothetical protein